MAHGARRIALRFFVGLLLGQFAYISYLRASNPDGWPHFHWSEVLLIETVAALPALAMYSAALYLLLRRTMPLARWGVHKAISFGFLLRILALSINFLLFDTLDPFAVFTEAVPLVIQLSGCFLLMAIVRTSIENVSDVPPNNSVDR